MKHKVFHIITHLDIGGSETVALNISKMNNPNYEFHFVEVVKGKGNYSQSFIEDLKKSNIIIHRSPFSTNLVLGAILFPFWFWKLHKKYVPDIYHSHTECPDVALFLFFNLFKFLIKKNTRVFRTLHNTRLWKHKHFIGTIIEHFFLKYQANVAISLPVKNSYQSDFKFYNKEIPIIYNGVEEMKQHRFEGIIPEKINILFAGRMVEQKGINILSEVILKLNLQHQNDFVFHIIGEGPLKEHLIDDLSKEKNVKFHGNIYNLASYLNSFDYLFMPSVHEGLSMLAIEASFAHLPAIINSCEGLVDTLPKTWPLKVKNNNINDYIKIFTELKFKDHNNLSMQAYEYVSKRFSIRQMQNKYLNLYNTVINKSTV